MLLKLTDLRREVVDRVTTEYLASQNAVLDEALTEGEREVLATLLRKLLASLSESDEERITNRMPARSAPPPRALGPLPSGVIRSNPRL